MQSLLETYPTIECPQSVKLTTKPQEDGKESQCDLTSLSINKFRPSKRTRNNQLAQNLKKNAGVTRLS